MKGVFTDFTSIAVQTWRLAIQFGGRRRTGGVLALTLTQAVLQMAAVASIMPFLKLAVAPGDVELPAFLPDWTPDQALLYAGILVILLQVLSGLVGLIGDTTRNYFGHLTVHRLSAGLLERFANRPYSFHLGTNSSILLKVLRDDAHAWLAYVLLPLLDFASRLANAILLLVLLLILNPLVAALVFLIAAAFYCGILLALRGFLVRASARRAASLDSLFQSASEMLRNFKVVVAYGRRKEFIDDFSRSTRAFAQAEAPVAALAATPRYLIETLAFGALVVVVLLGAGAGAQVSAVIPLAGAYALCLFRLLPTLSTAYTQMVGVLGKRDVILKLTQEVEAGPDAPQLPAEPSNPVTMNHKIELENISVRFAEKDLTALDGVSLKISKSSRIGFVGASGAGKSTLIDVLLGLFEPEGELRVDDVAITSANVESWRRQIGYVPQDVFLLDRSLAENIAFGVPKDEIEEAKLWRAIELAQLRRFVETELPDGLETLIGELGARISGGQQQRIALARALYHEPSVLLLDEATSALDPATERAVLEAIYALPDELTIISVAHRPSAVQAAEEIHVLERGRLVSSGDFNTLQRECRAFQNLFGVSAEAA